MVLYSAMYRFLIIDDEPVVREGISETIDWNEHGFELVGSCRDGREGLAAIDELRPDVVLTDVCMPFVDGLELAATIGEQYPTIKTILLTGYDEFEYAQEAVKLKVHDFLLKPITADELRVVLNALREEIDHERDYREKMARLDAQVRASLPVYRERFLNRLVEDELSREDIVQSVDLLDIRLSGPAFTVLIVDIDPVPQEVTIPEGYDNVKPTEDSRIPRLFALAVQEIIGEIAGEYEGLASFSTAADETVIILSTADKDRSTVVALDLAEKIGDRVQREISHTVSIGLGEPGLGIGEIPRVYREARAALEHRFVLGGNQIITFQQVRGDTVRQPIADRPELRRRFVRALVAGTSDVETILSETLSSLLGDRESIDEYYLTLHRILADTINALEAIGLDYREFSSAQRNPFENLSRMKTVDEARRWFTGFVGAARRSLVGRRQRHSQRKGAGATEYIEAHYADPDLSLQDVCNALAVSKSYLSPIFKDHTGMTFVEYLTARRIERAKELLGPGEMKVYEVAAEVGYRDAHYFSLTFKKQTGKTPREYQEAIRQSAW